MASGSRDMPETDPHLTIWTVYHSPSDHPGKWVLRAWDITSGFPQPVPRSSCVVADSLDAVRKALPPFLRRLPRESTDDPVIYESWV